MKEGKSKLDPDIPREPQKSESVGKLLEERNFEPAISVTENTTDLLYSEKRTRKLE